MPLIEDLRASEQFEFSRAFRSFHRSRSPRRRRMASPVRRECGASNLPGETHKRSWAAKTNAVIRRLGEWSVRWLRSDPSGCGLCLLTDLTRIPRRVRWVLASNRVASAMRSRARLSPARGFRYLGRKNPAKSRERVRPAGGKPASRDLISPAITWKPRENFSRATWILLGARLNPGKSISIFFPVRNFSPSPPLPAIGGRRCWILLYVRELLVTPGAGARILESPREFYVFLETVRTRVIVTTKYWNT